MPMRSFKMLFLGNFLWFLQKRLLSVNSTDHFQEKWHLAAKDQSLFSNKDFRTERSATARLRHPSAVIKWFDSRLNEQNAIRLFLDLDSIYFILLLFFDRITFHSRFKKVLKRLDWNEWNKITSKRKIGNTRTVCFVSRDSSCCQTALG